MEQITTDREIYSLWRSKTADLRYLRPRRWIYIKDFIYRNNIKSVIEFGSGVSTLLFDNLSLNILSLETDEVYMNFVKSLCSTRVRFQHWDNKTLNTKEYFDISLVDGILPRIPQLKYAINLSTVVMVDDYIHNRDKNVTSLLADYTRISLIAAPLAIFVPKDYDVNK